MPTRVLVSLAAVLLVACPKKEDGPETHAAAALDASVPAKEVSITFLVTGAENGYLLPTGEGEKLRGGAADVLGRWVADEGHCARGEPGCTDPKTVVLSTGDNANGQSISSYFKGQSTAEVMKLMGYAASAFGNRELDWNREQFLANTKAGGFPYLAANLKAVDATGQQLGIQPSATVVRRGVQVTIIGLAARKATSTPMPGRMAGVELISDADALNQAIPAARSAGSDVIVLVTDGCLHDAPKMLEAHPEWAPAFVAGRDCGQEYPETVGPTKLVYPGSRWNEYARVNVTVDLVKPPASRVTKIDAVMIEVSGSLKVAGDGREPGKKVDARTNALIASWKKKLDEALGASIGFSRTGLEQESVEMATWLTASLRERFKTDVAMLNRKGVRQGLPAGALTSATIWDLVPFENEIVIVKITGEQLLAAAGNLEARFSGLRAKGEGFVDGKGAPIDPKKVYTLATTDYLYLGGDGFKLHEADKAPTQTKVSWQSALIEWTREKKSDEKKPLETLLPK